MRKIKDVLRLKLDAKLSHRQIAAALGISKAAVTKYLGLAAAAGLDWASVQGVDEATLERRLLVAPERPRDHVQPDYGRLHQELRRKGVTLMLLWDEHRADYADRQTYGYTQFCENYRRFAKQLKRSMRQVHRAGEKLFIDYAGPTIGACQYRHVRDILTNSRDQSAPVAAGEWVSPDHAHVRGPGYYQ
jgi:transposase